jgi:A/G-specific adenine glycosylase
MPLDPGFRTRLTQRQGPGIWQGLYEFPLVETDSEIDDTDILGQIRQEGFEEFSDPESVVRFNPKPLVHKLSHQHLYVTFWIVRLGRPLQGAIPVSRMEEYPVPVLIANFMETVKNSYF